MVAQISPGEISGVLNSLAFAKDLVREWLCKYKFKNWTETRSSKQIVTMEMRQQRADEAVSYTHLDVYKRQSSLFSQ